MKKKRIEDVSIEEDIIVGKEWDDSTEPAPSAPDEEAAARGKNFFIIAIVALIVLGLVGAFFVLPALLNFDIFKEVSLSLEKPKSVETTSAPPLPKKPSLLSLNIENGLTTTNKDEVTLYLYAKNAEKCRLSNDGVSWSEWLSYAPQAKWKLSPEDGDKTVYYQCKNNGGVSDSVFAKIFLDKTPPVVSIEVLKQNEEQVSLNVKATDKNPYGLNCKLLLDGEEKDSFSGIYSNYFVLTEGTHKIDVVCVDAAGNIASENKEITITKENKKEETKITNKNRKISILINNGAAETNSRYLTLTLYADDAYLCRYKEGAEPWTSYEPYTNYKSWTSKVSESQTITIYYECKDKDDVLIGQAEDSIEYVKKKIDDSSGGSSGGGSNYVVPQIKSAVLSPPRGSYLVSGFTNSYKLNLNLVAQGVTQCRYMTIPWVPEPVWSDWSAYTSLKEIELLGPLGGDGDRLVMIECKNNQGKIVTSEARIIYDGTPPEPVDTSNPETNTLIYSKEINGTTHTYVMIVWLPTADSVSGVYSYNIDRMAMSEGKIKTNYAVILENGSIFYQFVDEINPADVYIYGFTTYDKANNAATSHTLLYCDPSQPLPANCH
ncbi:MAG: hypothetical protein QXF35_00980 [Candidatus Bilamarchaeaceae archaeon]